MFYEFLFGDYGKRLFLSDFKDIAMLKRLMREPALRNVDKL